MSDATLRPCPFCGSEQFVYVETLEYDDPDNPNGWRARCANCGAMASAYLSREEAVEKWNRRAANLPRSEIAGDPVAYRWKWDDEDRWRVVLSEESIPPVIRDCQPMLDPDLRGRYEPLYLRPAAAKAEGETP